MIIKGNPAGATGWWIKHLTRTDTNDRAELKEARGLLASDVRGALWEMDAVASGSRSEGNFMYQASINPRDNEHLTEEQWGEAVDTLEKNLGLEGHQRIVVEHEKEGRAHRHVVWNRVDVDTMRVADMGGNYYTHQRTARELEERFDLARTKSLHGERRPNGRPERAPEMWEQDARIDRDKVRTELTDAWRTTDSGRSFQAAIEDKGYILANGDRRAFVAVDPDGKPHSLARRIEGATAAQVKHRLADIDRDSLPSVAEARKRQQSRPGAAQHYDRDAAGQAWEDRALAAAIQKGRAEEREERRQAWIAQKTGERQARQPLNKIEKEVLSAQQSTAATPWALEANLEKRGITIARTDAEGREKMAADQRFAFIEGKAVRSQELKDGELVAVNRFGDVHQLNPQKLDLKALEANLTHGAKSIPGLGAAKDQIEKDRAEEKAQRARVNATRTAERRSHADAATAARTAAWERHAEASRTKAETNPQAGKAAGKAALEVVDAGGKVIGKLADVIGSLFDGGAASKPPEEHGHAAALRQMQAQRRDKAALERIRASMERGHRIMAADLHNLTDNHRENLRTNGDDYLRGLIEQMDRDRARAREDYWGRTRER